ncbi:hypothetical protein CBR_g49055 [Chara braunii]|uniref:FAD-binding domain-containing protein n=1 Tax=Chara braunii TaxID=69332 RepID=A0A388M4C6_CHABU|nr:hypothetical protein CBR_g49055 [Chara braunii]|eukprot:GBG89345.1 hypothetical protein CBR_g49055 [Chara braunii]
MRHIRALIIGAGMGGCTLSLALRKLNEQVQRTGVLFTSTVFEQAPAIKPVGAGIALGPNGLSILESLGLYPKVQVFGGEVRSLQVYRDDGQKLREFDLSFIERKHGYPLLVLERAELQALMIHEVLRPTVGSRNAERTRDILFNKRCVGVEDLGPNLGVRAHFADGTTEKGDVLLAADGLKSVIREQLVQQSGDKSAANGPPSLFTTFPRYSGISCVLGVTKSVPESVQGNVYWIFGPGRVYGTWSMGKQKQYWFLGEREGFQPTNGNSNGNGSITGGGYGKGGANNGNGAGSQLWSDDAALKGMDRMWNWFHPYDHHAMFNRTTRMVKVGMFETPWRGPWSRGNIALVGDAAHAMLPTINQGANMAIEDACAVARALAYETNRLSDALSRYEEFRKKRVRRLMHVARVVGFMQTTDNNFVRKMNEIAFKVAPQSIFERSMDWIMSYKDHL